MTPEEKKAKRKLYYEINKESILLKNKEYKKLNSEKIKETKKVYDSEYREKNKDIKIDFNKNYYEKTKLKRKLDYELKKNDINYQNEKNIKRRLNQKNRLINDPLFKISRNISTLISYSLKNKNINKLTKTEIILGCTFEEFKIHIESKFNDWMNWDNYGNPKDGILELNKTWDIDHVIPISSANNEADIIKLNHYTNLQPLCSYTNRLIKKDNTI